MTTTANPRDLPEPRRPGAALHQGDLRGMPADDRRSWGILRGHFSARATQISKTRLWKLPEPWTHRTRPPLFGKPHTTRFPTAPTGPIGNQSVTHVPG
jgi:hypothetical protein